MKEITHTKKWPEPISLALRSGRDTSYRNLLPGETQDFDPAHMSPEIERLVKRGHVVIADKVDTKQVAKSPAPAPEPVEEPLEESTPEEMSPEEIAKLEEELLGEDGSDAVSNEEA